MYFLIATTTLDNGHSPCTFCQYVSWNSFLLNHSKIYVRWTHTTWICHEFGKNITRVGGTSRLSRTPSPSPHSDCSLQPTMLYVLLSSRQSSFIRASSRQRNKTLRPTRWLAPSKKFMTLHTCKMNLPWICHEWDLRRRYKKSLFHIHNHSKGT